MAGLPSCRAEDPGNSIHHFQSAFETIFEPSGPKVRLLWSLGSAGLSGESQPGTGSDHRPHLHHKILQTHRRPGVLVLHQDPHLWPPSSLWLCHPELQTGSETVPEGHPGQWQADRSPLHPWPEPHRVPGLQVSHRCGRAGTWCSCRALQLLQRSSHREAELPERSAARHQKEQRWHRWARGGVNQRTRCGEPATDWHQHRGQTTVRVQLQWS